MSAEHSDAAASASQDDKAFATLRARAALAGVVLERMADGTFVAARWTLTRSLADADDVTRFLDMVGAPK